MPRRHRRSRSSGPAHAPMTSQMTWEERQWVQHRERLARIRPMVDCGPPLEAGKPAGARLGRIRAEQDVNERIQRENFNIFKALQKIHTEHEGPGRLDPQKEEREARKQARVEEMRMLAKRREQERIARENMEIFHRLNRKEPTYKVQDWLDDYEKSRRYKTNVDRRKPKFRF